MESTLSRRERERLVRRQTMLEAARSVFAEKGFTHATIEEVAQRAEFGKGTLYNYFEGGKEDLLLAIIEALHDDLCALIQASFESDITGEQDFRQTFVAFLESLFKFFEERQDLFMILMKETQQLAFSDDNEKASYFLRQSNRVVEALVAPLQRAIDRGQLRPLPPVSMAHTILGNAKGVQMHVCLGRRHPECAEKSLPAGEAAEFLSTLLLDGLMLHPEPVQTR